MKLFSFQAFLVAIAFSSIKDAESKVTSLGITEVESSSKHIKYVKQWSITTSVDIVPINSIDLSLSGNVFVSYISGQPSGVLGYVNVSGDSKSTVNAVSMKKDVDYLVDSELEVKLSKTQSSGYLLTEIFLATPNAVTLVETDRSAQVVIEDKVLEKNSKTVDLKIEAKDSSFVHVLSPTTDMKLRKLSLKSYDDATIEFSANSVSPLEKLEAKAEKSSEITLLTPTVKTKSLDLKSETHDANICISAKHLDTEDDDVEGAKRVSLPDSTDKHSTKGTSKCKKSDLPSRDAAKIVGLSVLGQIFRRL